MDEFSILPLVRYVRVNPYEYTASPVFCPPRSLKIQESDPFSTVASTRSLLQLNDTKRYEGESTSITLVLDASGSMNWNKPDMLRAVNSFVAQQADTKCVNDTFSFVTFADNVDVKFSKKSIKEVNEIKDSDYECDGCTALYDAISLAIDLNGNEKKAVIVVVTDGEDNNSRTSYAELQEKIKKKQELGWCFIYLADEPKVSVAFNSDMSVDLSDGIPAALRRAVSDSVLQYRHCVARLCNSAV